MRPQSFAAGGCYGILTRRTMPTSAPAGPSEPFGMPVVLLNHLRHPNVFVVGLRGRFEGLSTIDPLLHRIRPKDVGHVQHVRHGGNAGGVELIELVDVVEDLAFPPCRTCWT